MKAKDLIRERNFIRIVSFICFISLWEIIGRNMSPIFLPTPSAIVYAVIEIWDEVLIAASVSLQVLFVGFLLAVIVGIPFGMLLGRIKILSTALDPYLTALYSTPKVAIIPLIIIWFGLGATAKVVVVFLVSFFPMIINSSAGVKEVNPTLIETGKAFALSERKIFTKIVLPASIPYIMAGLRIAIGRAVVGTITAEMLTAVTGLGARIQIYGMYYATNKMFVPILLLAVLGIGLTQVARYIERKFALWKS